MSNIQLAANLRRLRNDHNYTQTQLGKKLNISRQAYSNYETGKRIPDVDMLIRIADIYHVSLEQLITQTRTKSRIINDNSGPYFIGAPSKTENLLHLTAEEINLLTKFRNASEDDRRLTRKVLGMDGES